VVLEDIERLSSLANGSVLARSRLVEIDQQGERFLIRHHQVDNPLQHEDEMVDLSVAMRGVLSRGTQVQTRPTVIIEAEDGLFSRLILDRDIVRGELL
jgi:hypothetical protein